MQRHGAAQFCQLDFKEQGVASRQVAEDGKNPTTGDS
jgi:hypothetical protein